MNSNCRVITAEKQSSHIALTFNTFVYIECLRRLPNKGQMIVTFACAKGQSVWQLHLYELHVGRAPAPTTPLFFLCGSFSTNIWYTSRVVLHPFLVPESSALSKAMYLQLLCILKCKV